MGALHFTFSMKERTMEATFSTTVRSPRRPLLHGESDGECEEWRLFTFSMKERTMSILVHFFIEKMKNGASVVHFFNEDPSISLSLHLSKKVEINRATEIDGDR